MIPTHPRRPVCTPPGFDSTGMPTFASFIARKLLKRVNDLTSLVASQEKLIESFEKSLEIHKRLTALLDEQVDGYKKKVLCQQGQLSDLSAKVDSLNKDNVKQGILSKKRQGLLDKTMKELKALRKGSREVAMLRKEQEPLARKRAKAACRDLPTLGSRAGSLTRRLKN